MNVDRLKAPIVLPRWSRHGSYRNLVENPVVPQLAPEIHLMNPDDLLYCDPGEDQEDADRQVDVCALEDAEEHQYENIVDSPTKRGGLIRSQPLKHEPDAQIVEQEQMEPARGRASILRTRKRKVREEYCKKTIGPESYFDSVVYVFLFIFFV